MLSLCLAFQLMFYTSLPRWIICETTLTTLAVFHVGSLYFFFLKGRKSVKQSSADNLHFLFFGLVSGVVHCISFTMCMLGWNPVEPASEKSNCPLPESKNKVLSASSLPSLQNKH